MSKCHFVGNHMSWLICRSENLITNNPAVSAEVILNQKCFLYELALVVDPFMPRLSYMGHYQLLDDF